MNAPPKPALNHDAAAWARVPRLGALLTGLAAPAAIRAAMPEPGQCPRIQRRSSTRQPRVDVIAWGCRWAHDQSRTGVWEGQMRISDVLRVKGGQVVTVTPDTDVRHLLTVLAEHRIGAVVVSHDGTSVDGIASERDIVRALAQRGATVMSEAITAIYTAEVHTVTPETPVEEVMRIMTEHRVRHAPVVVDGGLRGIVSIGDVVKNRIDELETEQAHLTNYITGTR